MQIGHVAREQAAALRPLLDDPCNAPHGVRLHTRVEALFPAGRMVGAYSLRLQLRFYGMPENRAGVAAAMLRGGIRMSIPQGTMPLCHTMSLSSNQACGSPVGR